MYSGYNTQNLMSTVMYGVSKPNIWESLNLGADSTRNTWQDARRLLHYDHEEERRKDVTKH